MTCPRCGAGLPPGAVRCVACGAARAPVVAAGVLTPVPAPTSDTMAPVAGETVDTGDLPPLDAPTSRPSSSDDALTIGPEEARPAPAGRLTLPGPGQNIGPRYLIIRMLGMGGMGAVYHAWDAELGVAVALKVIRPDVTADPDAAAAIERRFKRELLLARQVTHKHVVRIHDIGDVDGLKYITMSYVEGADLATILRTDGVLPVPRALRYARQIAAGLLAAHEAGVVHQDLKPANVMIDKDDHALIMDFGIAQSRSHQAAGKSRRIVGTLAYMAPEQARGEPTDERADIYAFGMMLREMLVGRRTPTEGTDALADLKTRMTQAPPRVRTENGAVPQAIDDIVARCVEPDPKQRYQKTAELVAAIEALDEHGEPLPVVTGKIARWKIAVAAVFVAAAIGGAAWLGRRAAAPPRAIEPVKILVADFDNRTGDAAFDGALEQTLTLDMEEASFITSVARRDAQRVAVGLGRTARLDAQTARLVAFRDTNVKYVLAGAVSGGDGRFEVRVDAVDPADGKVVKSASASASSRADVLAAVGTVASKLRSGLGDKTPEGQSRARETFTAGSLDAMREYSLAQDLQNAGRNEDALARYEKAIAADPKFGRAYSGAANAMYRLGRREEADARWKQALSLMDRMTDREKYRTLGAYYLGIAENYEKAKEQYALLANSYPSDAGGHANLALSYFYLHDFANAAKEGELAVKLDPKNLTAKNNQALYAMYASDFGGAAARAREVLAENSGFFKAYLPIAIDAIVKGDLDAASRAYEAMAKTGASGASLAAAGRGDLAMYTGNLTAAESELKSGFEADLATKSTSNAALKQIALAERDADAGQRPQAIAAAQDALKLSRQVATIVPAARVLIAAGKSGEAKALAGELEQQLQKHNRAYQRILLAEAALADNKIADAIDLLGQSRQFADLWLGRFDLGVAYVRAGHFAEAVSELEACEKRRGEATALFFDDKPTVRYLATLPYWLGRAQEGLGMVAPAKMRYESFLALRQDAAADPLVQDTRRRLPDITAR